MARRRQARIRASIHSAIGAAIGVLLFLLGARIMAFVACGIAGTVLAAALISPERAHAAIERLATRLGEAVGLAMTWLLLTPLFHLFFAPFGLLLRRGRRDRLERHPADRQASAWKPKPPQPEGPAAYERQF
jgi:hypothetical protein